MSVTSNLPEQDSTIQRVEGMETTHVSRDELRVRRRRQLAKWSQVITLIFVILETAIGFRVLLMLIAANPASPFAQFVYQVTGPFLAPFIGLTATPGVGGAVLDIPALIAMAVYGVLYWLLIRSMWVIFDPVKARDATKYEPDI